MSSLLPLNLKPFTYAFFSQFLLCFLIALNMFVSTFDYKRIVGKVPV